MFIDGLISEFRVYSFPDTPIIMLHKVPISLNMTTYVGRTLVFYFFGMIFIYFPDRE